MDSLSFEVRWRDALLDAVIPKVGDADTELASLLLGYRTLFTRLDADARDDVLRRAASLPVGADLVLLVKLLA